MAAAAMLPQQLAKHMRGAGECGIDIAVIQVEFGDEIVRRIPVRRGNTRLKRGPAIGNGRQRLVIDVDQGGRVFGDIAIVGNDYGNRLADMHHLVDRKNRTIDLLAEGRRWQRDNKPIGYEMRLEVTMRKHGVHAGPRQGGGLVDAADGGVWVRAAHKRGVQHGRQMDVVDETALATQEVGIFQTANIFAERFCAQAARPSACRRFAASSAAMTMFW